MIELIAKIGPDRGVELVEHRSGKVQVLAVMSPQDGAYLARGMLACSAALYESDPPAEGAIIADAHLPITKWRVEPSEVNGDAVLILTVPSGIELTFQMPRHASHAIGAALVALNGDSGTVG